MPLTEKELARFLWEESEACERRGLAMHREFFAAGRRYQHLDLGPYGVAHQVHVRFVPARHCYYVQVVLLSVATITTKLYQQAQRQASGVRQQLLYVLHTAGSRAEVRTACVLIGRQVQRTGDLVFALNLDASCQVFTYEYQAQGVQFQDIGKSWHITGSHQHPALQRLGQELLTERTQQLAGQQELRAQWLASAEAEPGALAEGLVITAAGVVENQELPGEGWADA